MAALFQSKAVPLFISKALARFSVGQVVVFPPVTPFGKLALSKDELVPVARTKMTSLLL